jgi:hypothetical protein
MMKESSALIDLPRIATKYNYTDTLCFELTFGRRPMIYLNCKELFELTMNYLEKSKPNSTVEASLILATGSPLNFSTSLTAT